MFLIQKLRLFSPCKTENGMSEKDTRKKDGNVSSYSPPKNMILNHLHFNSEFSENVFFSEHIVIRRYKQSTFNNIYTNCSISVELQNKLPWYLS